MVVLASKKPNLYAFLFGPHPLGSAKHFGIDKWRNFPVVSLL